MTLSGPIEPAAAPPENHGPDNSQGTYSFRVVTVTDAVDRAVAGEWDVPEFQREFVWKPEQVCNLADSLWRNYPIGPLLLWQVETGDSSNAPLWIADGQQRLTALCLLYGRTPAWLRRKPDDFRERIRQRFDIRMDISATGEPRFVAAGGPRRKAEDKPRLISTRRVLGIDPGDNSDRGDLEQMVIELRDAGCCQGLEDAQIYRHLRRVRMIRRREIVATEVNHQQRDDILDIFNRLNSRGMRFRRLVLKLVMEEIPAAIRGMRGLYQP